MSDIDTRELLVLTVPDSSIRIVISAPYPFTLDGLRLAIEIADGLSSITEMATPTPEDEIQAAMGGSDA